MKIPENVIVTHNDTLPTYNTLHWNILFNEFPDSNNLM